MMNLERLAAAPVIPMDKAQMCLDCPNITERAEDALCGVCRSSATILVRVALAGRDDLVAA